MRRSLILLAALLWLLPAADLALAADPPADDHATEEHAAGDHATDDHGDVAHGDEQPR